jgi:MFS family permease
MATTDGQIQRSRYKGTNWGAAFFGWLVATSVAAMLTALLSAIGSGVALSTGNDSANALAQNASTVGIVSGILLLLALAVAYYAGGYVAGRMSRFDGGRQGFGVWVIGIIATIVLAIVGVIFGSSFNLLQQINVPSIPIDSGDLTTAGLITLVVGAIVTALAAMAGGRMGHRYHTRLDEITTISADHADDHETAPSYGYAPGTATTFGERLNHKSDDDDSIRSTERRSGNDRRSR